MIQVEIAVERRHTSLYSQTAEIVAETRVPCVGVKRRRIVFLDPYPDIFISGSSIIPISNHLIQLNAQFKTVTEHK